MKLKLPKKKAAAAAEPAEKEVVPEQASGDKVAKGSVSKIILDENGQRRYNTQMFAWAEVFSTPDVELANKVKIEFTRQLVSVVLLFDGDRKEYVLFTTETFYSEARRLILEMGHKPWGVEDE